MTVLETLKIRPGHLTDIVRTIQSYRTYGVDIRDISPGLVFDKVTVSGDSKTIDDMIVYIEGRGVKVRRV